MSAKQYNWLDKIVDVAAAAISTGVFVRKEVRFGRVPINVAGFILFLYNELKVETQTAIT